MTLFSNGKQGAERLRIQLFADDDAEGRPPSKFCCGFHPLLHWQSHDLRRNVRAELLLARAVLNDNVGADLAVLKADELQRNNICSLMEELIEGVLSVGSGSPKSTGPVA